MILFSQQLEKADDSLHHGINAVAGFKMNHNDSKSTLQCVCFEQGHSNASIAERKNSFLCDLI